MKTAIVILNWNTRDYLDKFLPALLESAHCAPDGTPLGETEVIVADNASTDGSLALLGEKYAGVRLIPLDRNYGFTGGYNRALARLEGFDYFVLMNSDIEVAPGWLEPLTDWMDTHPDCAVCAPKLHSYQQRGRFEYAGAAGGYLDRFGYPFCRGRALQQVEDDHGQYDDAPADVFWATGACLLVWASLFDGLDDRFFAHMEEIDLCWRLQLRGYRITVVPDSTVWHVGGGTLPNNSPFKLRLNFRNNLLMLDTNLGKTLALRAMRSGLSAAKAARKGLRQAARVRLVRMLLDGCSALVYLCTLRFSFLRAVIQAHREYRRLRIVPDAAQVARWLENCPPQTVVRGLYGKWMVPLALFGGRRIFSAIKRTSNFW